MTGHRVTETDLFKLLIRRETKDGFEAAQISSRVNLVLEEAWPVLQQVSRAFPLYTLHDPEHSYRVAQNMARIVPQVTLESLNSVELSILIYAAYFHDLGMASSQEEFYRWLDSPAYGLYVSSRDRWSAALRRLEAKEFEKEEASESAGESVGSANVKMRCLQDMIYTDYLRETHAVRGAEFVIQRHSGTGTSPHKIQVGEVNYAREVALVCQSHWESPASLKSDKYRRDLYIGALPINLQYCAVLLRLADVIELDPERTPAALLDFIMLDLTKFGPSSDPIEAAKEKSAEEWAKHRAILGQKITADEIRIEARCSHPAIQKGLREWCDYIDGERRECRLVVRDNREEISRKYTLDLSQEVRKDYIQTDGSYIFTDFQLQLDYDRIVSLLMGTQLWGDPSVVVRELLQNALDACHHRAAISRRMGVAYRPRIVFSMFYEDDDDGAATLICEDNGTGMSQELIERYLMKVGSSYYESSEFRAQSLDFKPISHFGLGLMSCFMLASKISVETQHVDERLNKDEPLRAEFESIGRYVVLRRLSEPRQGTRVRLPISRGHLRSMDIAHAERGRRHRFWGGGFLDVLHQLAVHLDMPIEVQYGADHVHTIKPRPFQVPELNSGELPCLEKRLRKFEFDFDYQGGDGIAGNFRYLLPVDDDGNVCLGCSVEDAFKAFIDNDGDVCLTTPSYEDKEMPMYFGVSKEWDTDESRGVYRYKYDRKPTSERYGSDLSSEILEIVGSSFQWSQDGLLVGFQSERTRWNRSDSGERNGRRKGLFESAPIPGLNAADIDLREDARVALNVQRDDFLRDQSFDSFRQKYYALAAKMWLAILSETGELTEMGRGRLLSDLLERASEPLRMQLEPHIKEWVPSLR
jgi:Histidine kinase-, DNA gyrase B-, and HSP90-like ATPase